jgi:hypothetical protein
MLARVLSLARHAKGGLLANGSWNAADGGGISSQALQATKGQTEELRGHVIIAGFGRVGQIIGQLLAERLIPFVAVDVRMDCVQVSIAAILQSPQESSHP